MYAPETKVEAASFHTSKNHRMELRCYSWVPKLKSHLSTKARTYLGDGWDRTRQSNTYWMLDLLQGEEPSKGLLETPQLPFEPNNNWNHQRANYPEEFQAWNSGPTHPGLNTEC